MTPSGAASPVYFTVRRPLSERERFEICLGALLTQNTAWRNASTALEALTADGAVSPRKITALPRARLRSLIRSSGYYRQKAEELRVFCGELVNGRPGGIGQWFSGPLGKVREELLSIKGIGPETADSMLLYAGRRRVFVVDAYTIRLALRAGWLGCGDYHAAQKFFMDRLPRSERIYNEYHALIVELAKRYCTKSRPRCHDCPLRGLCLKKGVES